MSRTSALCRLITIPEWLAAPSKYQRYWVRYTLAGVASLWALRFLYMCGPPNAHGSCCTASQCLALQTWHPLHERAALPCTFRRFYRD